MKRWVGCLVTGTLLAVGAPTSALAQSKTSKKAAPTKAAPAPTKAAETKAQPPPAPQVEDAPRSTPSKTESAPTPEKKAAAKAPSQKKEGTSSSFDAPGGLYDTGTHERPQLLSFFGILPWGYGFGFGAAARYGIPILHDGFIPSLNDSFGVEFGADFWFASYSYGYLGSNYSYGYKGLLLPVEAMWSLHFTPQLSAYAKLGLGWNFYFWNDSVNNGLSGSGFWWNGAWGVNYQLREKLWLRGELGITGLKGGVGLSF